MWRRAYFPFAAQLNDARRAFEDTDMNPSESFLFPSDDLGDVCRDVKDGLLLAADGVDPSEVVWQWRFNFWSHWARHAYIGGASFDEPATRR